MAIFKKLLDLSAIIQNVILLFLSYLIVMYWFPFANNDHFSKYNGIFTILVFIWIFVGIIHLKFQKTENQTSVGMMRCLYSAIIVFWCLVLFFGCVEQYNVAVRGLGVFSRIGVSGEVRWRRIKKEEKPMSQIRRRDSETCETLKLSSQSDLGGSKDALYLCSSC